MQSMNTLFFCVVIMMYPLFAWEGKVFDVSGKKVTIASSQTSGVRAGTRLYILKDGKEVGQGRVGNVFHTKVEMTLVSGVAEKGQIATDKGPSKQPIIQPDIKPTVQPETKKPSNPEADAALLRAIEALDIEQVETALNNGADANARNAIGTTPIFSIVNSGRPNILRLLIARGANVNYQKPTDVNGFSALKFAAIGGNVESLTILLDAGANPNLQGGTLRNTALMLAAQNGREEVVRILLSRSADPNLKTGAGDTAIKLAAQFKHASIMELLRSAGAKE